MYPRISSCAISAILAVSCGAAQWPHLPVFDGSLSGEIVPLGQNDGVAASWRLKAETVPDGSRAANLVAEGEGLTLRGTAVIGRDRDAPGEWVLSEAQLHLDPWFRTFAQKFAPQIESLEANGVVSVSGAGQIAPGGTAVTGNMLVGLNAVNLSDPMEGWSLTNLTGQIALSGFEPLRSGPGQRFTFGEAQVSDFSMRNGIAEVEIASSTRVKVQSFRMEAMGGVVTCEPFELDLNDARVSAKVQMERIQLSELQAYFPDVLKAAVGRISGELEIVWDDVNGVQFGRGTLRLEPGEAAVLRLSAEPGFLSSNVPTEFDFLPQLRRFLSRTFLRADNPAHVALQQIEQGRESLIVEELVAEFYPPSEGGNASAIVKLVAKPASPAVQNSVRVLRLNVNVSGPLTDVIRFGMDGRLSFD